MNVKGFEEAKKDGYKHITQITDPDVLRKYREEGVLIDAEGYYSFTFGEHKEYEQRLEPIGDEGVYYIVLYKNGIPINHKLPVKGIG